MIHSYIKNKLFNLLLILNIYININIILKFLNIIYNIIISNIKYLKLLYIFMKYTNIYIKYNISNKLIIIFIFLIFSIFILKILIIYIKY